MRFVKVPLDGDLSCLNIDHDDDPDDDLNDRSLTGSSYVEAYAQRKNKNVLQPHDVDKKTHLHECSLTEFVRSYCKSFKKNSDGDGQKLFIYPRAKRFHQYSHIDRVLGFADKRYPLIHVARFYPQKNPDPAHPTYPQWCRFALMQHKPWDTDVLRLWNEYMDTKPTKIEDIPADVFEQAW